VAAWGIGGEPFHFPEQAGYPMGEEHGGATYYMFEVSMNHWKLCKIHIKLLHTYFIGIIFKCDHSFLFAYSGFIKHWIIHFN